MRASDIVPLHLASMRFPAFHPLAGERGIVRGFLIRHPDGPILMDSGVGLGNDRIDGWYQPEATPIGDALGAHGVAVGDLTLAVTSHLHFDHCGQNAALGGCPIVVQARELAAAAEPKYTIPEWVNFPGSTYMELDGDSEIAAGVRVIPTPGHTPGHQSLAVATDDGLVLLVGQALYTAAEYEHVAATGTLLPGDPPPDPAAYLASAMSLIELRPSVVLFAHDEAVVRPV